MVTSQRILRRRQVIQATAERRTRRGKPVVWKGGPALPWCRAHIVHSDNRYKEVKEDGIRRGSWDGGSAEPAQIRRVPRMTRLRFQKRQKYHRELFCHWMPGSFRGNCFFVCLWIMDHESPFAAHLVVNGSLFSVKPQIQLISMDRG